VKELGGLIMLVNMLQTRKNSNKALQKAAAIAVISIVENDGM